MDTKETGFTLVELLVAIAIMASMMAILLPNFMGARERARDAQKIQDMSAMKTALRLYYNDNQSYPATIGVGMTGYMSNIVSLGYTYAQTDNGDGFVLCSVLEAGVGNDDTDSQNKCGFGGGLCGVGVGFTADKVYAVCAK
ncbi:MAG: type II secretion system protein [Microgenomates group bacterium]